MIEGMKLAFHLGNTQEFKQKFESKPFTSTVPGCPSQLFSTSTMISDEYLECVAKTLTNTFTHAAGTCRMGSIDDANSVVSSKLKLHGINGLRVVDSSIVPQSTSGALYATTLMIGERGAQFILDDYPLVMF